MSTSTSVQMQAELQAQLTVAFALRAPPRAFVLEPDPALRARLRSLIPTQSHECPFQRTYNAKLSRTSGGRGGRSKYEYGEDGYDNEKLERATSASSSSSRSSCSSKNVKSAWVSTVITEAREKERQKSRAKPQTRITEKAKDKGKGKATAHSMPSFPQWIYAGDSSSLRKRVKSAFDVDTEAGIDDSENESEGRSDDGNRDRRRDTTIDLRDPRSGVMPATHEEEWLASWRHEKARMLADMSGGLGIRVMKGRPVRWL